MIVLKFINDGSHFSRHGLRVTYDASPQSYRCSCSTKSYFETETCRWRIVWKMWFSHRQRFMNHDWISRRRFQFFRLDEIPGTWCWLFDAQGCKSSLAKCPVMLTRYAVEHQFVWPAQFCEFAQVLSNLCLQCSNLKLNSIIEFNLKSGYRSTHHVNV